MKSEKELNDAFKALIELSDKEIEEVKNIIDEIIEYKIQDEETISHLFDRILSIVFIEDNEKMEIFYKLSNYTRRLNKEFSKNDFDRLVYLHPNLLSKINELFIEFNYNYHYESKDIIDIFKNRIERQLSDLNYEQYIDCSYISICSYFPELKSQIDALYDKYKINNY